MNKGKVRIRNKILPTLLVVVSTFFLLAFLTPKNRSAAGAGQDVTQKDTAGDITTTAEDTITNPDPVVYIDPEIKADPVAGFAPLTVEFGAVIDTERVNLDAMTFRWNFDTGDTETGRFVKHTFEEVGEYRVSLVIDNGEAQYIADTVLITVYRNIRYCRDQCLIAEKIQLDIQEVGDTPMIFGQVLVRDEHEHLLEGAEVKLIWTRPDGHQIFETAVTGRQGIARSGIQANHIGVYTLMIDDIDLEGYKFDRLHSLIQSSIRR